LESSILASLPKGSSYYSPYSHKDRLMGYFSVYEAENPKDITQINEKDSQYKNLTEKFKEFFVGLEFKPLTQSKVSICNVQQENLKKSYSIDNYGCIAVDYGDLLTFLNNIKVEGIVSEVPPVSEKSSTGSRIATSTVTPNPSTDTVSDEDKKTMILEYNT